MGRPRGSKNKSKELLPTTDQAPPDNMTQEDFVWPNGVSWGIVQLPRDLRPFPTQRIVQTVNENGKLSAYITESSYHRSEVKGWYDKLFRDSYSGGISKGAASLMPVKSKLHWRRFEPGFLSGQTLDTPRMDPTTGEEEK